MSEQYDDYQDWQDERLHEQAIEQAEFSYDYNRVYEEIEFRITRPNLHKRKPKSVITPGEFKKIDKDVSDFMKLLGINYYS